MSQTMQAVSPNSMSANSTGSSITSNKVPKITRLDQRKIDGRAKKLALIEKYKDLLRVIKIMERYHENVPENGSKKKKMPLARDKLQKFLGSAQIYRRLPNITEIMTNEEIERIIEKQKMKMIQGVLRGEFPEFKEKTIQLERLKRLKKEQNGELSDKNKEPLRIMRNKLLKTHKNLQTIVNVRSVIKEYFDAIIKPLKKSFERYEQTTQAYIKKNEEKKKTQAKAKQAKDAEKEAKKKARAAEREQFTKGVRLIKQFRARQRKLRAQEVKERKKGNEKAYREKAKKAHKDAEKKARAAEREEKAAKRAAEKEAIKQAAILTAGRQMSSKNLAKF